MMGGIQIRGFFTILPICSMEVPSPWEIRPPHLFSRKLITAKPTILAQQPATAAPPASPVRERAAQMAAEEMGRVSAMPTSTETMIPIRKGCKSVAHMISCPRELAAAPIPGASSVESATPVKMVTKGVTRISTFVSLETTLPHSDARMAMIRTASGPPAPPSSLAAPPTAAREKSTSGGACRAKPMEIAMAGPATAAA